MEEIIFTRLTVSEMRLLFREELQEVLAQLPPVEGVPQEDLLTTSATRSRTFKVYA